MSLDGIVVPTADVSPSFIFNSGKITCSVALISRKKALYHFKTRDGGSGDKHKTFSVCRNTSWHLAFSSSRVVVFLMIASLVPVGRVCCILSENSPCVFY